MLSTLPDSLLAAVVARTDFRTMTRLLATSSELRARIMGDPCYDDHLQVALMQIATSCMDPEFTNTLLEQAGDGSANLSVGLRECPVNGMRASHLLITRGDSPQLHGSIRATPGMFRDGLTQHFIANMSTVECRGVVALFGSGWTVCRNMDSRVLTDAAPVLRNAMRALFE